MQASQLQPVGNTAQSTTLPGTAASTPAQARTRPALCWCPLTASCMMQVLSRCGGGCTWAGKEIKGIQVLHHFKSVCMCVCVRGQSMCLAWSGVVVLWPAALMPRCSRWHWQSPQRVVPVGPAGAPEGSSHRRAVFLTGPVVTMNLHAESKPSCLNSCSQQEDKYASHCLCNLNLPLGH